MRATENAVSMMILYCAGFALLSGIFLYDNASILVLVPPVVVAYTIACGAASFSAKGGRRR